MYIDPTLGILLNSQCKWKSYVFSGNKLFEPPWGLKKLSHEHIYSMAVSPGVFLQSEKNFQEKWENIYLETFLDYPQHLHCPLLHWLYHILTTYSVPHRRRLSHGKSPRLIRDCAIIIGKGGGGCWKTRGKA